MVGRDGIDSDGLSPRALGLESSIGAGVGGALRACSGNGAIANDGVAVAEGQHTAGDEDGEVESAALHQFFEVDVSTVGAAVAGRKLPVGGSSGHKAHRRHERNAEAVG